MSDFAEELFADMVEGDPEDEVTPPDPTAPEPAPEFYPGSKRKITRDKPHKLKSPAQDKPWDRNPRKLKAGGVEKEFFTIGALAEAINRKPVTIRSWEASGIMPKARYRTPDVGDQPGRRLYTRHQVEGMIELCAKHGILEFSSRPESIPKAFTDDVIALWIGA